MKTMKDWHQSHPQLFLKSPRNHAGRDTYQWAMKGMPLYFFAGDGAKGDAKGDGVKGVWDAVQPN